MSKRRLEGPRPGRGYEMNGRALQFQPARVSQPKQRTALKRAFKGIVGRQR